MTLTTGRLPRRTLLIGLMTVFTIGNLLTASNWLGGRFADRSVDGTLMVMLASLAVLLIAFLVGDTVVFMNAIVLLVGKLVVNLLLWSLGLFIAPIGMAYLWFRTRSAASLA